MAAVQTILGVVLAGGLSARMGQDKSGIRLDGVVLAERAARRLRPQVAAVAINANAPLILADRADFPVFPDLDASRPGPLGGVLAALDHARRHHPAASHVATVPTDSPFFPADLVARLAAAADGPDGLSVAASPRGPHPVFALWPVTLADDLAEWLSGGGTRRVRSYLDHHGARAVLFPAVETPRGPFDPFFNVNTPDDLVAAEAWRQVLER